MVAYYRNRRFAAEHGTGYEGKVCAVCDDLGYVGCFCGRFVPYPPEVVYTAWEESSEAYRESLEAMTLNWSRICHYWHARALDLAAQLQALKAQR